MTNLDERVEIPSISPAESGPDEAPRRPSPAGRESFLDTVRSIATVRVVLWHAFGTPALSYLVASMPTMFFVAGSLLAASLDRRPATEVLRSRAKRLLIPFWIFGAFVFVCLGIAHLRVGTSATAVSPLSLLGWLVPLVDPKASAWEGGWLAQPLWYLRAFLWLLIAAPLLRRLHRRFPRAIYLPMVALVFVVDWWVRHPASAPPGFATWRWYVGDFALYAVFLILGFAHRDGAFRAMDRRARVEWAGIAAAVAVIWCVTQPIVGDIVNNSYPAHLFVGLAWLFAFLTLEPVLAKGGSARGIGAVVRWLTKRSMTVYLWHTTAIVAGYWILDRFAPSLPRIAIIPLLVVFVPVLAALTGWAEDLSAGRPMKMWPTPSPSWWPRVKALDVVAPMVRRGASRIGHRAALGGLAGVTAAMMLFTTVSASGSNVAGSTATTVSTKKPPAPSARPDTAVFDESPTAASAGSTTVATRPGSSKATPARGSAELSSDMRASLQQAVEDWRAELKVDGVVVSMSLPDGSRWSSESGSLSLADPFAVTSLTKTFTAALVLRLVDEGKIDLNAPLPPIAAVPDFPYGGEITPAMLLNHTSGLSTYQDSPAYLADPGMAVDPAKAIELAASQPLLWAPGSNSGYSSSGYLLAGLLTEQAGDATYGDQLVKEFFEPLGLENTMLDAEPVDGWIGWSTGGVVTTMDDLVTWGSALYRDKSVLSTESTSAMMDIGNEFSVGLGAWPVCPCSKDAAGAKVFTSIGHNGGSATLQYSPADGLVIAAGLSEPIFNSRITQQDLYELLANLRAVVAAAA